MNTPKNRKEHGQAIVLIAIAIIGLVGMTALAVDGGNAFADRRQAQNAADSAAFAAALSRVRGNNTTTMENVAKNIALSNGYDDVVMNWPPNSESVYEGNTEYVQVIITSDVDTFFAPVIGVNQLTNTVQAVARAKPPTTAIPFDGAAMVGLNPAQPSKEKDCPISAGQSASVTWTMVGGGIFSNGCAYSPDKDTVTIPDDKCATAVGTSSGFDCTQSNQTSLYFTMDDIVAATPPKPPCDDTAEGGYIVPSNPSDFTFSDGIYCVSNFDALDGEDIVINNAVLYVTDPVFKIRQNGGKGSFTGTAYNSGSNSLYDNYAIIIAPNTSNPCPKFQDNNSQVLVVRGNGATDITGTFWAPTTCIDLRGNGTGDAMNSQVVGWNVSSNGTADVYINYDPDENAKVPVPPQIELSE